MPENTLEKLEKAIKFASESTVTDTTAGQDLIIAASEALGVLQVYKSIDFKQILYDMTRLAAGAAWVPDDFNTRGGSQ